MKKTLSLSAIRAIKAMMAKRASGTIYMRFVRRSKIQRIKPKRKHRWQLAR